MTLFYDPVKRKPKVWALIAFVVVPILLVVFLIVGSKGKVQEVQSKRQSEQSADIFKDLDAGKVK